MLDVCSVPTSYDEYIATVKTGNDCQLSAYILLLGKFATMVCCAKVLFQPSFLHVVSTLHAEWSTDRTTKPDTAQTQTERVLTRLVDTASLDSRLHQVCISQATRVSLHNIHELTLFHPVSCCTHNSSWFLGSHFAHGGGAVGCSTLIHGSTS